MSKNFEETRKQWRQEIEAWKASGQNAMQWCREKHLQYKTFLYWKKRFSEPCFSKTSFIEIPDEKSIGIEIRFRDLRIHLNKHFDERVLKQCLSVLLEMKC